MSNVNNITSKILKDAEVERDNILASAEEEKQKIISKKVNSAKALEKEMLDKAKAEGSSLKSRIISSSKLKVRNDKLTAKQELIEDVFSEGIEKLVNLPEEQFLDFLKNTILSMNLNGDENIILNKKGLEIVKDDFINSINTELQAKGVKGSLKVSKNIGNFKGGFILEKSGIEINNTYEALVSAYRDELELEIVKVLFN